MQPVGIRVVDEEGRQRVDLRVMGILEPVSLERCQVVRIADLLPDVLEDREVALLRLAAYFTVEETLDVDGDLVVVEQRIVDVHQEYDRVGCRHAASPCAPRGRRHRLLGRSLH
jgi:hypothetical protein